MEALVHSFGIDWKLMLAQSVNFAVLVGVLSYFVYGPVMKLLRERTEAIKKGIEDAAAAARERAAAQSEKTSTLASAEKEASAIVSRAKNAGSLERAAILKDAEARAEVLVRDAEAAGREAARLALKESEAEIARTAILAAEKILAKS